MTNFEEYTYTADNYIDKIDFYLKAYGSTSLMATAKYTVTGGNYTGYSLKGAVDDGHATDTNINGQYSFTYHLSKRHHRRLLLCMYRLLAKRTSNLPGMPYDNLSPLPRVIKITYRE